MSKHDHDQIGVPRGALFGAVALVALTIAAAAAGRISGIGTVQLSEAALVDSVSLHFEDRRDGAVVVRRPGGALVEVLAPGSHGFVRGVLRGLARDRRLSGIGPDAPFVLNRWSDGRLSLEDPATARRIDLGAFGADNVAAFVRFVETPATVANITN